MLIGFKFSNYKSFKDSVEFSMEPLTKNGAISNAVETAYIYNWIVMDIAVLSTPYELNLRSDIAKRELDLEEKTKFLNKADIHIDRLVSNRDGLFSIHKSESGKEVAFNFEEEESEGTIILLALSDDVLPVLENGKIYGVQML